MKQIDFNQRMTDQQTEFVEQVGRFWEGTIGSRAAGRILGWLMISEPVAQSASDLVEILELSAGSVSTQVRMLERIGLIERVTFPGDRVRYYQMPVGAWMGVMDREREYLDELRRLAALGEDVLPSARPGRVRELGVVAEFFSAEWPALMKKLETRLGKAQSK